jgi:tRNA 2-thiouridine synthesizing protein B
MLHTVNKSPFEKNSFETCLRLAAKDSAVLLIEDAVYAALKGTALESKVRAAAADLSFYVLGPDLRARGLEDSQLVEGFRVVDYGGFVDLAAQHDKVLAWV